MTENDASRTGLMCFLRPLPRFLASSALAGVIVVSTVSLSPDLAQAVGHEDGTYVDECHEDGGHDGGSGGGGEAPVDRVPMTMGMRKAIMPKAVPAAVVTKVDPAAMVWARVQVQAALVPLAAGRSGSKRASRKWNLAG